MQQIKLFKNVETEIAALEEEVNTWIRESGVRVLSVEGNIAPQTAGGSSGKARFSSSDVLLIVLYETAE